MTPSRVLFVTWDGPQVAYLETLFVPIFERMARRGVRFHVVQFTWAGEARTTRAREACEAAGIPYRSVRVWRRPKVAGALASALLGARAVARAARDFEVDAVMPRSHLPGLAVLCGRARRLPMVFDADGLPLDEAVEFAGRDAGSPAQRFLRDLEAQLVRRARVVLTRSRAASEILLARAGAGTPESSFHVVRNGRDPAVFHPRDEAERLAARAELGVGADVPLVVYCGSLGAQYCPGQMIGFMQALLQRCPAARWLVLSAQGDAIAGELARRPEVASATVVKAVDPADVPRLLACADLGLALRSPSFSMRAVAPVKLGEYLMCGVPVLATAGVGETDAIGSGAGRLVGNMDAAEVEAAVDWLVEAVLPDRDGFRERCAAAGRAVFSLAAAVESYADALAALPDAR
jgi:glycosyltransferase involved in cell wall biosynthesis